MNFMGIFDIYVANYKRDLEYAFSDYLEEEVRTPKRFRECMIDRLADDFMGDIILDEETIAQAIKDTKRFIEEALKNI